MIELIVNGESRSVEATTLRELLAELGLDERGLAVAVGGEVVPRGRWAGARLEDGQAVDIVGAAQGG